VDLCITLGGDGTVLHLATLFEDERDLPPVIRCATPHRQLTSLCMESNNTRTVLVRLII
jgi:NAD+ kinase